MIDLRDPGNPTGRQVSRLRAVMMPTPRPAPAWRSPRLRRFLFRAVNTAGGGHALAYPLGTRSVSPMAPPMR